MLVAGENFKYIYYMEKNNITMTPYPYDASIDLQKTTTCTNESINVTYNYNKAKDLNKNTNETYNFLQETVNAELYWQCPECKEFNVNANGRCPHCGYVRTIKC